MAGREQAAHGKKGGRGNQKPSTQKVESRVSVNESEAAAVAASTTGTNRQYVAEAKKLKEENPEEFEQVKAGKTTLTQAQRLNHRKKASEPGDAVVTIESLNCSKVSQTEANGNHGQASDFGRFMRIIAKPCKTLQNAFIALSRRRVRVRSPMTLPNSPNKMSILINAKVAT